MKRKVLQFADWLPDQPDLGNPGTMVRNAIPQANSYRSMGGPDIFSDAIDSRALGAIWARDSTGAATNLAGDAEKLYVLDGSVWDDISKAGGYTGVTSWEFVNWGGRVIGASLESALQYYDLGASSLFDDLPGSPPSAKHIGIVRDFVVLGNIDDGTNRPSTIFWSGYNNSELWTPSQSTQCDFQDLLGSGGRVQKVVSGEYGVIFQESSIWRMDYVGPPVIFQFNEVETQQGTPAPGSVVWYGRNIFYWGNNGFYVFNGQASQPIGSEKINRYVSRDIDYDRIDEFTGVVDRAAQVVMWSYPSNAAGTQCLIYSWAVNKWALVDTKVELLYEYSTSGYTLDQLDSILSDIDNASINVDSTAYLGGLISVGAFTLNHELMTFSGAPIDAEIETGEIFSEAGRRIFVSSARPLANGNVSLTVASGTRDVQNENYAYGPFVTTNYLGVCDFDRDARYHRFKVRLSGEFSHAIGIEVMYKDAGFI